MYVMDEILTHSCTFCHHISSQLSRYLFRLQKKTDKKLDKT